MKGGNSLLLAAVLTAAGTPAWAQLGGMGGGLGGTGVYRSDRLRPMGGMGGPYSSGYYAPAPRPAGGDASEADVVLTWGFHWSPSVPEEPLVAIGQRTGETYHFRPTRPYSPERPLDWSPSEPQEPVSLVGKRTRTVYTCRLMVSESLPKTGHEATAAASPPASPPSREPVSKTPEPTPKAEPPAPEPSEPLVVTRETLTLDLAQKTAVGFRSMVGQMDSICMEYIRVSASSPPEFEGDEGKRLMQETAWNLQLTKAMADYHERIRGPIEDAAKRKPAVVLVFEWLSERAFENARKAVMEETKQGFLKEAEDNKAMADTLRNQFITLPRDYENTGILLKENVWLLEESLQSMRIKEEVLSGDSKTVLRYREAFKAYRVHFNEWRENHLRGWRGDMVQRLQEALKLKDGELPAVPEPKPEPELPKPEPEAGEASWRGLAWAHRWHATLSLAAAVVVGLVFRRFIDDRR